MASDKSANLHGGKGLPKEEVGPDTSFRPQSFKGNDQAPEPDREPVPTYRTDMGEGLPPQKDTMNPDRAK